VSFSREILSNIVWTEFSKHPHLEVDGIALIGRGAQWDIAVMRQGPDAFRLWDQIRVIAETLKRRYLLDE
jgi:hypothetical protein